MIPPGHHTITASAAPTATVPAHDAPAVSFITVTFGTGPIIVDMIASLVASLSDSSIPYEVVVVDNRHPTLDRRARTELSLFTAGVQLITTDRNLGFGGGCELGALHAAAPILGFLNPDTSFQPGWLEPLVETLTATGHDAPSIVAPVLREPDGTVQESGQRLDAAGHTSPNIDIDIDIDADDIDYASAACWLITSDEHERIGGFDPAYHPAYFEDVDYALRARSIGRGTSVDTSVSVVHHRGLGTPGAPMPATEQHGVLMRTWPEIRWRQPRPEQLRSGR